MILNKIGQCQIPSSNYSPYILCCKISLSVQMQGGGKRQWPRYVLPPFCFGGSMIWYSYTNKLYLKMMRYPWEIDWNLPHLKFKVNNKSYMTANVKLFLYESVFENLFSGTYLDAIACCGSLHLGLWLFLNGKKTSKIPDDVTYMHLHYCVLFQPRLDENATKGAVQKILHFSFEMKAKTDFP